MGKSWGMESLAEWKEVCSDRPLCNEADTSSFGMLEALPDHLLILCLGGLSRYQLARLQCVCRRFRNLLSPEILLEHRQREGLLEPWLCVVGGVHVCNFWSPSLQISFAISSAG